MPNNTDFCYLDHYQGERLQRQYTMLFGNNQNIIANKIADEIFTNDKAKKVLDIGGGTGELIELLKINQASRDNLLPSMFILVEPFDSMIAEANQRKNPPDVIIAATGEGLLKVKNDNTQNIDVIILQGVIHHIRGISLEEFFKGLYNMLNKNGKIVLITRPLKVEFPMGEQAKKSWKECYTTPPDDMPKLLQKAGFIVSVSIETFPITINRVDWLAMIKTKNSAVFSNISALEQSQIDQDYLEIKQKYAKNSLITFLDHQIHIIATKP